MEDILIDRFEDLQSFLVLASSATPSQVSSWGSLISTVQSIYLIALIFESSLFQNKVSLSRLVILVINRPSAARAFLQLPPSLIHSSIKSSFVEISSEHLHSQAVRAGELNFWENVHPPSCVTACKVSWKKNLYWNQN